MVVMFDDEGWLGWTVTALSLRGVLVQRAHIHPFTKHTHTHTHTHTKTNPHSNKPTKKIIKKKEQHTTYPIK